MRILFLALLLCALPVWAQPEAGTPAPAPIVEPQHNLRGGEIKNQIAEDLQRLTANLQSGNIVASQNCVYDSRLGFFGASEWVRDLSALLGGGRINIRDVAVLQSDGEAAKATISYSLGRSIYADAQSDAFWRAMHQETLDFKLSPSAYDTERRIWKMVPPEKPPLPWVTAKDPFAATIEEMARNSETALTPLTPLPVRRGALPREGQGAETLLANIAYHLAQKQELAPPTRLAEVSLDKLKVLGLAAAQIAHFFESPYALAPRYLIEALSPWVKDPTTFQVPGTNEIYVFNANLSGLNTDQVKTPAQTVLFYEGQNEQPIFRYDGQAAVCFADGHVALVSPDEAQKLIWKP